jgi:hypothetical protein
VVISTLRHNPLKYRIIFIITVVYLFCIALKDVMSQIILNLSVFISKTFQDGFLYFDEFAARERSEI